MSELSPEEKRRIYLEEKARLEAQEQLKQEQEELKKELNVRKRNRTLSGCLMLFALLWLIGYLTPSNTPSPTSAPSSAKVSKENGANPKGSKGSKAADAKFNACKKKLEQARSLDVLYDFKMKGARPQVFVGPTWFSMPVDAKEGFHETVQCYVTAGEGGANTLLEYRHL